MSSKETADKSIPTILTFKTDELEPTTNQIPPSIKMLVAEVAIANPERFR